jgi:tetraacyldisaccharide 4'-kinase
MKSLDKYWYSSNAIALLLLPVSWFYCGIVCLRKKLYQLKIKKSFFAEKPLIVIGNIAVGGSGKTPLLIALCDYLQSKGYKPGVVSRGYGGNVTGVKQVSQDDEASLVGDEPLMICQKTKVPVVVGADRVAAVNFLLAQNQCDVVLSDDGLQHYRMDRALEICVVDSVRGHGNGYCLPAGPLREPLSRLKEVDIIVYSNPDKNMAATANQDGYILNFVDLHYLNSDKQAAVSSLAGKTVHAVAGIGNPLRFFQQLRDNGLTIVEHTFPDHHKYEESDFSGWDKECILMTEKDAVKCKSFTLPDAWFVNVKAILTESLESKLANKLLPLLTK